MKRCVRVSAAVYGLQKAVVLVYIRAASQVLDKLALQEMI
jgi:hypothetical protein